MFTYGESRKQEVSTLPIPNVVSSVVLLLDNLLLRSLSTEQLSFEVSCSKLSYLIILML